MNRSLKVQVDKFLQTQADLLIFGATGTGKTTLAKNICHQLGAKGSIFEGRDFSFIEFAEHVRKSQHQPVIIEDIEKLSFRDQTDLLLWLENSVSRPRLIFTTRIDIRSLVAHGNFRADLFYKISVVSIKTEELNSDKSQIPDLAQHLLGVYQILHSRHGLSFSSEALEKIKEAQWPGNYSELENVIERAVLMSEGPQISSNDIEVVSNAKATLPVKKLADLERDLIIQTLRMTDQNRTRTAELLGISIRTLRNKIQEYRQEGLL